jgi:hypothetical protein
MTAAPRLREDFLASFCFAAEGDAEQEIVSLSAFAASLEKRFRFWEIVYVLGERKRSGASRLAYVLSRVKNIRVIAVTDRTNLYRRRAIAVSEAIGDVVVLTSFAEAGFIDPLAFAEQAYFAEQIVRGRRKTRWKPVCLLHWLLTLITSYRIDDGSSHTIALPRTKLNALASRPTFTLDLRFEPKYGDDSNASTRVKIGPTKARHSPIADRFELLEELVFTSAPRMLRAYAIVSSVVTFLAFLYGLYAVGIVLFKPDVQTGWFSTAIVQSGSVGFIAIGMAVIAMGLADIAERLSGHPRYEIVDEIANTRLFARTDDVNVELAADMRPISAQSQPSWTP